MWECISTAIDCSGMQLEIWEQWPCVLFSRPPSRLWRSRRRHGGRVQQKICWTWVDFEGNQEKFPQGPEFLGLQNQWSPTLSIFQRSIQSFLIPTKVLLSAQQVLMSWIHSHIIVDSCRVSHSHILSYISQFPNIS